MRKLFNYALLAAALLVGVNVNAETKVVDDPANLATTINAANNGDVIQLGGAGVDFIIPDVMDIEFNKAYTVTLDLNGHNLIYSYNAEAFKGKGDTKRHQGRMIRLKQGTLRVINDRKATGGNIENRTDTMPGVIKTELNLWEGSYSYGYYASDAATDLSKSNQEIVVFSVTGDPATNPAPAKGSVYTKLYIAPEVTVSATKGKTGIVINQVNDAAIQYTTPNVIKGSAFGVVVEVGGKVHGEKYGIQVSGNVGAAPKNSDGTTQFGDNVAYPIINVLSTAEVWSNPVAAVNGNGMYIGGYAIVTIKGYVHGSNGVYIKSGDIDIVDAVIASDNPNYNPTQGEKNGSGTEGSGNAIVIESTTGYAGGTDVTISGDTKVEAQSGYAIQEVVTKGDMSKVEGITIEGGSFIGGDDVNGAIVISEKTDDGTKDVVVVNAGSFSDGSANAYINTGSGVITPIIDANGDTVGTVITTDPNAPKDTAKTAVTNITCIDGKDYVYWESNVVGATEPNVVVAEGQTITIKNFTADWGTITVKDGGTLIIDNPTGEGKKDAKMMLMGTAVVTLEPGAKMISKSTLGVETASAANLIISAQEGKMAQFFYHPDVNQGRHPLATVKYYSRAKKFTTWDRFGVPAFDGMNLAQMRCETSGLTHYLYVWNNSKSDWDIVNNSSFVMKPFQGLTLTNNSTNGGIVYDFPCAIVGNVNADLNLDDGWNSFSNSYTAEADVTAYLEGILETYFNDIEGTIYTYKNGQETTTEDSWNQISTGDVRDGDLKDSTLLKLEPMKAFIIRKISSRTVLGSINYKESIWDPAFPSNPSGSSAPRRMTDMNKVVINLTDAQGNVGRFTIREAAEFTADFDNGYDATLYESASKFNFYAATDYSHQFQIATDDIEGQVLTLATKGETSFTMSFSNVRGEKMALRDNLTGDVIEMAEGVTYNFMANANEVSERFTVVSAAKAPTAIENATAKAKAAKFINKGQVVLQNNGRMFNVLGVEL